MCIVVTVQIAFLDIIQVIFQRFFFSLLSHATLAKYISRANKPTGLFVEKAFVTNKAIPAVCVDVSHRQI